jgi:hypothetical protein
METAVTTAVRSYGGPRPSRTAVVPVLFGFLLGVLVLFSRRPDTVLHAQFWAEDGRIYYSDVYNLGIERTIFKPQAGYFQTFPVLVAWLARLVALRDAPYVTDWSALLVQALPVALLCSRRAASISPDIRVRALIAFVYLIIPNETELDATAVNQQWSLVVSALIVLMFDPPARRGWRVVDGAILIASGLTGPFAPVLAVLAWIRRRVRGADAVPLPSAILLSACAVVQLAAVLYISHHVSGVPGVTIEGRTSPQLGATTSLFARLVGGRVLVGTVAGEANGMRAPLLLDWAAIVAALVTLTAVVRARRVELLMMIMLGAAVLGGALLDPTVPSPAWPILAALPPNVQRYFFLGEAAVVIMLIWIAIDGRWPLLRIAAAAAVVSAMVFAIGHWTYQSPGHSPFASEAAAFQRAPRGTVSTLVINPHGWSMTLKKQ